MSAGMWVFGLKKRVWDSFLLVCRRDCKGSCQSLLGEQGMCCRRRRSKRMLNNVRNFKG